MKFCKRVLPLLAVLLMFCVSGCRGIDKIKDIKVTSWSLKSVVPSGLRSVNAELEVGIDNPAMEFTVGDIEGVLYYKGRPMADYSAEPVTVRGKSAEVYPVSGSARLAGDFSLLDLLSLAGGYDPADFTADLQANVRLKSGISKTIHLKNLPIKSLVK